MWYYNMDKDGIVISSRVRFARNLKEYNFPHILKNEESEELIKKVHNILDNTKLLHLNDIDSITLSSLVERHLISKEFVNGKINKGIILSNDCTLSIMINEEDHLRIQGFSAGKDIKGAYDIAKKAENEIGEKLEYAMHDKFGYITACPTNIGSGMRVSVMLHLPALTKLGYISKLLEEASQFGIAIRGLYGENTYAKGNIYQISNQKTMGMTDEEIISNVDRIVTNVIKQEKRARAILMEDKVYFEDRVMRALGILKFARRIDTVEAEKNLSLVRMGIATGIIKDIDVNSVQKLSVNIYPSMLQIERKKNMEENERDIERANYMREELK